MAKQNTAKVDRLNRWIKAHWLLSILLVILAALLLATAVQYHQTHSYIANPDPALFNK